MVITLTKQFYLLKMSVDFAGRSITGSIDTSNFVTNASGDISYINAEGDKMFGKLDMNKNKITNIAIPTEDNDCVNKVFVDNKLSTIDNKLLTVNYVYEELNSFKQSAILIHEDMKRYKQISEDRVKSLFNFENTISDVKINTNYLKQTFEDQINNIKTNINNLIQTSEKTITDLKTSTNSFQTLIDDKFQNIKTNIDLLFTEISNIKNIINYINSTEFNKLILIEGAITQENFKSDKARIVYESDKPFLILHEFWYHEGSRKYIQPANGYFIIQNENGKYQLKFVHMTITVNISIDKYKVLIYVIDS